MSAHATSVETLQSVPRTLDRDGASKRPSTDDSGEEVRSLVEEIARSLVDGPDRVQVRAVRGEQVIVLELSAAPGDLGKLIGKQGRTARSLRTILAAVGTKVRKRFTLQILE